MFRKIKKIKKNYLNRLTFMLHSVIYNYKINKDLEKSGQGKENEKIYRRNIRFKSV